AGPQRHPRRVPREALERARDPALRRQLTAPPAGAAWTDDDGGRGRSPMGDAARPTQHGGNPGRTGRTTGRAATMSASVPATTPTTFWTATKPQQGVASRLTAGFLFVTTGLVLASA